jgi:EAL domain-containing protein (putative c-di-GMP-specific phosphodiesterase class I)
LKEGSIPHATNRRSQSPSALRRRESIRVLKDALAGDRLVVHYQPIVEVVSGRAVTAEGLVRWRHPDREPEPLPQLVKAAEHSRIIYVLEHWVVATCFADAARWQKGPLPELRVNVNLSAREFDRPHFGDRLRAAVRKSGVDPRRVTLEITETSAIEDPEAAGRMLDDLKKMGFEIWLDDFGTGHSTMEWLWRLPIDGLKVPETFVQDVTHDAKAATITAAIVELAHRLGVRITAEGIENEDQRGWLTGAGCDELQGFLFYQPMPVEELLTRLSG